MWKLLERRAAAREAAPGAAAEEGPAVAAPAGPAVEAPAGAGAAPVAPAGPAGAAAAPAAPAAPAGGTAAVAGRGGLGRRHAVRLAIGKSRKTAQRRQSECTAAIAVANPNLANRVSRNVWGFHSNLQPTVTSGTTLGAGATMTVRKADQHARDRRRGVVSHMFAVRQQLKTKLTNASTMLFTEVQDDASVWVREEGSSRDKAVRKDREQRNSRLRPGMKNKKTGRNKCYQIMNNVQHVAFRRDVAGGGQSWASIQIHSPATVLPGTNWATLLDRKRRWSLASGGNVGRHLRRRTDAAGPADADLQDTVSGMRTVIQVCVNDAANVNDCMARVEQDDLIAQRTATAFRMHQDSYCMGHQGCLVTRPVYEAQTELPTVIVRLGHILQGAIAMARFLVAVDAVVEECFQFREVFQLPPETAEWRETALSILEPSIAAGQLTQADADEIVDHDNCLWSAVNYTHYCRGQAECKSHCADARQALEKAKSLTRSSLSGGCPIALLYRWKHMPAAMSFAGRGRGEHDVLPRALQRMWSTSALEEAVLAAELATNVDELSYATKTATKAASVMRFFAADVRGARLLRGEILAGPAQAFISQVMAADKASVALADAEVFGASAASTLEAFTECQRRHYRFISGENGLRAVESYTEMICNLQSHHWRKARMSSEELLDSAWLAVSPMANIWRRAVHYFEDPRWHVYKACTADGERFLFKTSGLLKS